MQRVESGRLNPPIQIEGLEPRRLLSAGDLDPTFGTGGKAIQEVTIETITTDSALLSDGKILIAGGTSGPGDAEDFFLRRLNPDGSPDTSFGKNGDLIGSVSGVDDPDIFQILVQPDGKILGKVLLQNTFGIVRFNADGSVDTNFAKNGVLATTLNAPTMGLQADGKIIVASQDGITRYNADGSIDTTFGTNGVATNALTGFGGQGLLAVQTDGKFLLGGSIRGSDDILRFGMARFNSDGSLDTSFGANGQVLTSVTSAGEDFAELNQLAILPSGKILAAGRDTDGFALIRYNADGSVDTSFANPAVLIHFADADETVFSMSLDANGNAVLIGGGVGDGLAVARVTPSGQIDETFGRVIGDNDATEELTVVGGGIQSNGNIVVVGQEGFETSSGDDVENTAAFRLLASDSTPAEISLDSGTKILSIDGTSGNDLIEVEDGFDALRAVQNGFGRVFDTADVNSISITGDAGNDQITTDEQSVPAFISGGDGSDKITGGEKNDTLMGNGGRDFIDGGAGTDHISGGGGNDQLRGQAGNDLIHGGPGNDYVEGDGGNDRLDGGAGIDVVHGNGGNDRIVANDGQVDSLFGDGGADTATVDAQDILQSIESVM